MKVLLDLFNSLDEESITSFDEFINSPYFNKRSDISRFFGLVSSKLPVAELNRAEIYSHVYNQISINEQVVDNLLSRTKKLLLEFLTIQGIKNDDQARTNALAFELAKRGMYKLTEKTIEKGFGRLENEFYTVEYLKKYYDYTELKESLTVSIRNFRQKTENALHRGEAFVNYYILNLLRIANDFIVFKYVNNVEEDNEIFNGFFKYFDFEKYIENLRLINSPYYAITSVFYYGLQSKMNDPNGFYREELKRIVFENLDSLNYQDKATCWTMLFAAYVFSNTPPPYNTTTEIHKINKYFIERDIWTKDELGYFMENNYHNIAIQAINSKDYTWAEKFLNKYKNSLPPDTPDHTYNTCLATIRFKQKRFEDSLKYISRLKIDNVMSRTNVATLNIRCYYELGYYEEAHSGAEALRQFHIKNKVLPYNLKKNLLGFAKYVVKIIKCKALQKRFPEEIYIKAKNDPSISSKPWVLDKMQELMNQ